MWASINKYWKLLNGKERWHFRLLIAFIISNGLVELVGVGVVPVYIRLITDPELLISNIHVMGYFPGIVNWTAKDVIVYGAVALFIIYVFKTLFMILNNYYQERFIRGREMRMSTDLFSRYLNAPIIFHLQRNTAELTRNSQTEIQRMNQGFIVPLFNALTQVATAPLILLALLLVNPLVSVVTFVLLGIAILLYNSLIRKKLMKYGIVLQKGRGDQIKAINQGLGGIKEVKILQRISFFIKAYKGIMDETRRATIYTQLANRINGPYLEFIALMGMLLMATLLVSTGTSTEMLAPLLAFYVVSMFRIKQSVTVIMTSYTFMKVNHITIDPIYQDMALLKNAANALAKTIEPFNDKIEVRQVSYSYPTSHALSLNKVSLVINKGESIGIVGSTGAGKTTLIDILLGLLEPQDGDILVDGVPIKKNLHSWQCKIGYIPQQIYLLDDTIRANVAFAVDQANVDDSAVWRALKAAQLADFVRTLPDSLNTLTGERGVRMSGGQRQRIGIARALYHNPPVLVMDEATAALDNKTEMLFIRALENIKVGHTLVIIAHRLSTIKHCDKIIVMERGEIKAIGSYEKLLQSEKVFQELAQ